MNFTQEQLEIFNGSMLGDGHLSYNYDFPTWNSQYVVTRNTKDKEYLKWNAEKFSEFSNSESIKDIETYDKRTNKIYYTSRFRTKSLSIFTDLRKIWYPSNIKTIPSNLQLTPLALAIWFCDDGCISLNKRKGKKDSLRSSFATNSFSKEEVILLVNKVNQLTNSKFILSNHSTKYIIRGSSNATNNLVNIIKSLYAARYG